MKFLIDEQYNQTLLRSFLKGTCHVSTRLLVKLKANPKGITVNGEHVTVRYLLKTGDILEIDESNVRQECFAAEPLSYETIFEDEFMVIVNKPPYMPTHPSNGHNGDTLANAMTWEYRQRKEPFVFRPVSRLDRNTSGVITIAKSQYAAGLLGKAMKLHELKKTYLAITEGVPEESSGTIHAFIHRKTPGIVLREVCTEEEPDAEQAVTEYKVLSQNGRYAFLELHPLTGRTHQIRVHLASIGCPVLGDELYGSQTELIERQALHAYSLNMKHPVNHQEMTFYAELPEDMKNVLELLELQGTVL